MSTVLTKLVTEEVLSHRDRGHVGPDVGFGPFKHNPALLMLLHLIASLFSLKLDERSFIFTLDVILRPETFSKNMKSKNF